MDTDIYGTKFLHVVTERSKLLDICSHSRLVNYIDEYTFILWQNEGEYAIISKGQMKEALRVFKELNSAPEDHLSTAGFPCIFWDDCEYITTLFSDVLLGKEHEFYREAKKPDDGSDSGPQ